MKKKLIYLSNLSWNKRDLNNIINILKENNITGIDCAPLQISNNWVKIENKIKNYSKILKKKKIKINAVQGIFYKKKFNIFKDYKNSLNITKHIKKIINLCKILNCKKIILGSSYFRDKKKLTNNDADKIFKNFLKQTIPVLKKNKITLCLEAIPKQYNENYLYNFDHLVDLVNFMKSGWIKINFDTSLFHYKPFNLKKLKESLHLIGNFQISQKKFKYFTKPSKNNLLFLKYFKKNKMLKSLSLEIISNDTNLKKINLSLKNLTKLIN